MKIHPTKEWCQTSAKIEGDSCVQAGLPNAVVPHEKGQTPSVDAVATGSLWVPAAYLLTLAKAWERVAEMQHHDAYEAQARDNCMTIATSTAHAKADAIAGCAKELRSLVEDASERQPTENP